jgi:hypothetical protein
VGNNDTFLRRAVPAAAEKHCNNLHSAYCKASMTETVYKVGYAMWVCVTKLQHKDQFAMC